MTLTFGRDHSRYPKECRLCTLAVLHPGVPVMWQTHIRDLSPTAEAVRGAALPRYRVALVVPRLCDLSISSVANQENKRGGLIHVRTGVSL